ncbi:hypothetical protein BD626DRAFT_587913 [Schizophyllum amplum]|uniref:DUF6589 domain-containing protein n=1 Tax=Schizophyllum amplum TaxID=97359 RepID=A0A550BT07_9AGAR|nr:hypothetical protein BD626DRAFT_587913 [Auriculariopsis ampla]
MPVIAHNSHLSDDPDIQSNVIPSSDDTSIYDEEAEKAILQQRRQDARLRTLAERKAIAAAEDQQLKEAWERETAEFRERTEVERARQRAMAAQDTARRQEDAQKRVESLQEAASHTRAQTEARLDAILDQLGNKLDIEKMTLADLLERAFDPDISHKHDWIWRGFFQHRSVVRRVFNHWTSPDINTSARETVREWVLTEMEKIAEYESDAIINSSVLRKAGKTVDEAYFLSYQPRELGARLRGMASGVYRVLAAFSRTTAKAQQQLTDQWRQRKETSIMGTYFMATGAQRQHFSILSGMGISMGYSSIISHGEKATAGRAPGTLSQLSDACRRTAQKLASTRIYGIVYDNINMTIRIAEQILGRKNAQENGTCATAFPLHNVVLEDLDAHELDECIKSAPPLTEKGLRLTEAEQKLFHECMLHTVSRIIVNHGGEEFSKHQKALNDSLPRSPDAIDVHKTSIHPLPAMEIDENTLTGNVEILETVMKELKVDVDSPEHTRYVSIIAGDQLTMARQRSIQHIRVGHEVGFQAWKHVVLMPGLFHAKIADCHGLLETHFGRANSGPRSPGSLSFHNKCLGRIPIVLSSLPPFRTTRDLIFVSLYARVLHCLLLVTKTGSLKEAAGVLDTWDDLRAAAQSIVEQYTDVDRVQELREEREPEERQREKTVRDAKKAAKTDPKVDVPEYTEHVKKGDMVFENAVLFMRDALLSREFSDAIKAGDSGRVLTVFKLWVFSYRGSGRTKYAHEMLHLLHNILNVWPKGIRHAILQNWLQNPTGKPNAFVEIDLVQEHLNYWIKRIYKADGDGHSWTWLAMVSPTVNVLRQLANHVNSELGAKQGKKHAAPDIGRDIARLMDSLEQYEVYVEKPGRVLDYEEKPAPDVIAVGMAALTCGNSSNPLMDFNAAFEVTRQRHTLMPLAMLNTHAHADVQSAAAPSADESAATSAGNTTSTSNITSVADVAPRRAEVEGMGAGDAASNVAETELGVPGAEATDVATVVLRVEVVDEDQSETADDDGSSDEESSDEDEHEDDEATLPLIDGDDVALDMDDEFVELEEGQAMECEDDGF